MVKSEKKMKIKPAASDVAVVDNENDDTGAPSDDSDKDDAGDPAEEASAAAPLAAVPACRVCGCTETTPCADAAGDACAWANTDMTLCTCCAARMQAFEEQIDDRGAAASRADLIELVEQQSDIPATVKVWSLALDAVIAAGDVVAIGERLLSGKVIAQIEQLCSRGPKSTAQVRASFKRIDVEIIASILEILVARGGDGALVKDGDKWVTSKFGEAPTASPAARRAATRRKSRATAGATS